jgi:hypothetical protein
VVTTKFAISKGVIAKIVRITVVTTQFVEKTLLKNLARTNLLE